MCAAHRIARACASRGARQRAVSAGRRRRCRLRDAAGVPTTFRARQSDVIRPARAPFFAAFFSLRGANGRVNPGRRCRRTAFSRRTTSLARRCCASSAAATVRAAPRRAIALSVKESALMCQRVGLQRAGPALRWDGHVAPGRYLGVVFDAATAIIAEIFRLADFIPDEFRLATKEHQRQYGEILFDFSYFKMAELVNKRIEDNPVRPRVPSMRARIPRRRLTQTRTISRRPTELARAGPARPRRRGPGEPPRDRHALLPAL